MDGVMAPGMVTPGARLEGQANHSTGGASAGVETTGGRRLGSGWRPRKACGRGALVERSGWRGPLDISRRPMI